MEFASVPPAFIDEPPPPSTLASPSCDDDAARSAAIPNVVYQAWLGGGKLMFAKLLSVLSVHYLMRPERHYILYDEEPRDADEWRCACRLARCRATPSTVRLRPRPFPARPMRAPATAVARAARPARVAL